MSSIFSNTNIAAFNPQQLIVAAKNVGVLAPTATVKHDLSLTPATLLAAIKAK